MSDHLADKCCVESGDDFGPRVHLSTRRLPKAAHIQCAPTVTSRILIKSALNHLSAVKEQQLWVRGTKECDV